VAKGRKNIGQVTCAIPANSKLNFKFAGMIERLVSAKFEILIQNFPAVGIIGARQVGKTTLVKKILANNRQTLYLDLERPSDIAKLKDAELFLELNSDRTVILDEIHHKPELFSLLRALIDDDRRPGRFIILGSASPKLLRQSAESLAGRIAYLRLFPLNFLEVEQSMNWQELWFKGGFPEPLQKSAQIAKDWHESFVLNYTQRDLPALGIPAQPAVTLRLLQILASSLGSNINYSSIAKSLSVSMPTVKTYLEFLENAFLIYTVRPWAENMKKRIVKSPKLFFEDTGMLHNLLGIHDVNALFGHIVSGHSWENFVINQIRSILPSGDELYYYRTQDGAEIDLLVHRNNKWLFGAEIKLSNAPQISKGTFIAMSDLKLKHLFVVTPDSDNYLMHKNIEVIGLLDMLKRIATL
jgi:uncharacterized protein